MQRGGRSEEVIYHVFQTGKELTCLLLIRGSRNKNEAND